MRVEGEPVETTENPLVLQPSASYGLTMRVRLPQRPGSFGRVASAIGETGAILGAIDLVRVEGGNVVRDVTVACADVGHGERVVEAIRALDGVSVDSVSDRTFLMHRGGKIDIGPVAAMPVMEGKAMLFKEFAGVDAFPVCLGTKDVDEIVAFVKAAAPPFGGINLEDISAPRCFEIERRLTAELDIPVFHDDQHGTAIVVLAALLNALRVVGKTAGDIKVVVVGAGAAGVACAEIILAHGVQNLIVCDIDGALHPDRPGLDPERAALAARTNPLGERGMANELLAGADVLVGVSG